uniref:Uncharacterized protein n=1 Tax=Sphingobacterium sp. (strain 21) TaxID=743722 RepID=F4C9U0_SPHS2
MRLKLEVMKSLSLIAIKKEEHKKTKIPKTEPIIIFLKYRDLYF